MENQFRDICYEGDVNLNSEIRYPPDDNSWELYPVRKSWMEFLFCGKSNLGLNLEPNERILFVGSPAYLRNVLCLGLFWIVVFCLIYLIPFLVIENSFVPNYSMLRYFLHFSLFFLFLFCQVYIVCYKLVYKKLTIHYILTDRRAIVLKGTGKIGYLKGIVNQYAPVGGISNLFEFEGKSENYTSYYYKEMNEIFYMTHSDSNDLGSIFFGYEVVNYSRLFSVMSRVKNSGFEMISGTYYVLDIILYYCKKEGFSGIRARRLFEGKNDPALTSKVIHRVSSCCGFIQIPGICSIKPPREGKISEDEFKKLTCIPVDFV